MKKFLPLIILAAILLGLLGYLGLKSGPRVNLTPFLVGEMTQFELFEDPKPLPETPFLDRQGTEVRFSDFRGKTLLVNFWATWCEPCKEEMPTLDNLEARLGDENFRVITVSIDWQGFGVMDPFFEEFKISNLEAYWDNSGKLPNELDTIGLPLTILVGPDGKWLGRRDGPLVWDSPEALEFFKAAREMAR